MKTRPDHEVAIIGAGPGGIAAGVLLRRAGITDFVMLERANAVGGSWRDNRYPGVGVDIPSFAYQYSFARKPDWSHVFARGAEVLAYHEDVVQRFGLQPHLRFGCDVVRETWDESAHWWVLELAGGTRATARFVISAVGAFLKAKDPDIAGIADFTGKIQRPDAWDAGYDLRGKRVAMVGTGASAVQIVPSIAADVSHLAVFQRTPVWCLPKPDAQVPASIKWLLGVPGVIAFVHGAFLLTLDAAMRVVVHTPAPAARVLMRAFDGLARRAFRSYLKKQVIDAQTRASLEPTYGPLTKRPTTSNQYYRAFNRPNVSLLTQSIERIVPEGIRTTDGATHAVDTIILATGYELFSDPESYPPGRVSGRAGFDLGEFYASKGLQAYESVAVSGLPNRWTLVGPYSWTGTGWHLLVEITAGHAVRMITQALRKGSTAVEIRPDAQAAYHAQVKRRGRNINWYFHELNHGVRTYYLNSQGDAPFVRPSSIFEALRRSRHFPLNDYIFGAEMPPALESHE